MASAPPAAAPANEVDAALASKFFPNSPSPQKPEPAAVPSMPQPKSAASDMLTGAEADKSRAYPSMSPEANAPFVDVGAPPEVLALREADPNRRMYSAQMTYKSDLPDSVFDSVEGEGITPELRQQVAGVWREVCADMELSTQDVAALVGIFQAPPPTPEVQEANRAAATKWLIEAHGDGAGAALAAAQALVARDPRVAALLDRGAGDDPRVVKKVVAAALRQVASGKLKVGGKK
jgi:hypothetical protein